LFYSSWRLSYSITHAWDIRTTRNNWVFNNVDNKALSAHQLQHVIKEDVIQWQRACGGLHAAHGNHPVQGDAA
jgi:hypothetical protein